MELHKRDARPWTREEQEVYLRAAGETAAEARVALRGITLRNLSRLGKTRVVKG